MTNLRAAITALVVVLLVAGWAGAALASIGGTAADWAIKVDAAPVRTVALIVLLGAIALAFVPEKENPT